MTNLLRAGASHDVSASKALRPDERPSLTDIVDIGPLGEKLSDALVKALRSGLYTQGQEQLRYIPPEGPTQYCCLGLMCHLLPVGEYEDDYFLLYDVYEGEARPSIDNDNDTYFYMDFDGHALPPAQLLLLLPPEHRNKAAQSMEFLAQMNDGGATFNEIAEIIETVGGVFQLTHLTSAIFNIGKVVGRRLAGEAPR